MRTLHIKVAGVTFDDRQELIARLHGDEVARIVPEPDNPYDENALAVFVVMPPEAGGQVNHVGYIPREFAAQIAPLLDGEPLMCRIEAVTGGNAIDFDRSLSYGLRLAVQVPEGD